MGKKGVEVPIIPDISEFLAHFTTDRGPAGDVTRRMVLDSTNHLPLLLVVAPFTTSEPITGRNKTGILNQFSKMAASRSSWMRAL